MNLPPLFEGLTYWARSRSRARAAKRILRTGTSTSSDLKNPAQEADDRDTVGQVAADGEKIFKRELFKGQEGKNGRTGTGRHLRGAAVDAGGTGWVYREEEGHIDVLSDADLEQMGASAFSREPRSRNRNPQNAGACRVRRRTTDDEAFDVGDERYESDEECPGRRRRTGEGRGG